jgi:hypothetical protein
MKDLFNIPSGAILTDKSDKEVNISGIRMPEMKRLRIDFRNGNAISIIRGEYSYGGKEGFFEIMPTDNTGCLKNTKLDVFEHDSVCGWLTIKKVNEYIEALSKG